MSSKVNESYRNNDKTQLFESLQPELYVEDKTDEQLTAETDAFEGTFPDYILCDRSFYFETDVALYQMKGRIVNIDPEYEKVDQDTLCKIPELVGLDYVQSRVSKQEQVSTISHSRYIDPDDTLFTIKEIIDIHNPLWIETYEKERKGLHEVLCERNLNCYRYYLENIQKEDIDFNKNINLGLSNNDEIIEFYELNNTWLGTERIHTHDIIYKLRRPENYLIKNDEAVVIDTLTYQVNPEIYQLNMENIDLIYINEQQDNKYIEPNDLNINDDMLDFFKINKQYLVKEKILLSNGVIK